MHNLIKGVISGVITAGIMLMAITLAFLQTDYVVTIVIIPIAIMLLPIVLMKKNGWRKARLIEYIFSYVVAFIMFILIEYIIVQYIYILSFEQIEVLNCLVFLSVLLLPLLAKLFVDNKAKMIRNIYSFITAYILLTTIMYICINLKIAYGLMGFFLVFPGVVVVGHLAAHIIVLIESYKLKRNNN